MLKCPVCGCCNFPDQDTSKDFPCPVIGCDGMVETSVRANATRMWQRPANASLDWARKDKKPSPFTKPTPR